MKAEIGDEIPFLFVCLSFEGAKPMMNTVFCQMRTPLRGKDKDTLRVTSAVLDIVIEGTACFVEEINVTKFFPFVTHMQPANLRAHMGMLHQEVCSITHPTTGPVAQGKEGLATEVIGFLHQIAKHKPLIG